MKSAAELLHIITLLCEENGEPCDGFRFRELVLEARAVLAAARETAPELPEGWKAAPPIMTAAMSQAWIDAMQSGLPTWPAVLAAMPSPDEPLSVLSSPSANAGAIYTMDQMRDYALASERAANALLTEEVERLQSRIAELESAMTSIAVPNAPAVSIERVQQRSGPDLWAVRTKSGCCLNKEGEWEDEPQPSSRDDAFLCRCRFATPREALDAAIADAARLTD